MHLSGVGIYQQGGKEERSEKKIMRTLSPRPADFLSPWGCGVWLLSASIGREASEPLCHQKTSPRVILAILDKGYTRVAYQEQATEQLVVGAHHQLYSER